MMYSGDEVYPDEVTSGPPEDLRPCSVCGSTKTVDIHAPEDTALYEQTITVCADCGSDEP